MHREFMPLTVLALLGVATACNRPGGTETALLSGTVKSGDIVAVDSLGQGSGGHLKTQTSCHYEGNILVCTLVTDSLGIGSGGHYPARVGLVLECSASSAGKELKCTAPVGARQE